MFAQNLNDLGFTRQQIEVVVFEKPAERIAVGIAFQCHTAGKLIGGHDQRPLANLDVQLGFRKAQTSLDVRKGIRAGQDLARSVR